MRSTTPSMRWMPTAERHYIQAGGHIGPATWMAARDNYIVPLYAKGATAEAAGYAAARMATMHSELEFERQFLEPYLEVLAAR